MKTQQLAMGIEVEKEHKDTYAWVKAYFKKNNELPEEDEFYARIAKDHLKENPDYYSVLKTAKL